MNKFWIQQTIRIFLFAVVLGTVCFSCAFAETSSYKSETGKIDPAEIQKALTQAGFYRGTIDGVIGKKTRAALREFQTKHDLTADGVCGPKTWEKLKTYLEEATEMDSTQDSLSPAVDEGLSTSSSPAPEPEPSPENTSDELKQKLVS